MASRKISINMSREISTMNSLKKTIEPSHNVFHGEVMSIKDLKAKNARELKHVLEGENGLPLVSKREISRETK